MFFENDTPEQIRHCLECKYPKCINCLERRTRQPRHAGRTTKPPSFDTERAEAMYREGRNDIEIASGLKVSRQKIGRWRRMRGLKPVSRTFTGAYVQKSA